MTLIGDIINDLCLSRSDQVRIPSLVLEYMAKVNPVILFSFIARITAFLASDQEQTTPGAIADNDDSTINNDTFNLSDGFASLKGSIKESVKDDIIGDMTQDDSN